MHEWHNVRLVSAGPTAWVGIPITALPVCDRRQVTNLPVL